MAVHTYNSWGRTRAPKNIAGPAGTAATVLAHTATPSGATAGYSTENQRYLHVTLDVGAAKPGQNLNIWTYSHASGMWGKFTQINYLTGGGGGSGITIDYTVVVEIDGADRVALQRDTGAWTDNSGAAPTNLYAACSTF